MFAVKGWSVDSSALKTQQAAQPAAKKSEDGTTGPSGQNKKRKRGGKDRTPRDVTAANVGDMWATTIEGKKAPKKPKIEKKDKTDAGDEAAAPGADEQKTRKRSPPQKKRKRTQTAKRQRTRSARSRETRRRRKPPKQTQARPWPTHPPLPLRCPSTPNSPPCKSPCVRNSSLPVSAT
jgi:ribosomal RNA-processing protein 8